MCSKVKLSGEGENGVLWRPSEMGPHLQKESHWDDESVPVFAGPY